MKNKLQKNNSAIYKYFFVLITLLIPIRILAATITGNNLTLNENNSITGTFTYNGQTTGTVTLPAMSPMNSCGADYCYRLLDTNTLLTFTVFITTDPSQTSAGDVILASVQAGTDPNSPTYTGNANVTVSGAPALPVGSGPSSGISAGETTGEGGEIDQGMINQVVTLFLKIGLIFAAALVPMVIGDKLAGAISGSIGKWSKGARESAMKQSKGGAYIAAKRKLKEDRASARAFQGIANRGQALSGLADRAAGATNKVAGKVGLDKLGFDATRLSNRMTAGGYGALARANAIKAHMTEAEGMTKDERNKYLSRYARLNKATGEWQLHDKKGFMKDHRAMAMVQAQSDAGLLNDDDSPRLEYLNDMRGSMLAAGNGAMVGSTKENGGYDYLNLHHLKEDVHAALGQHGSALGNFKTPEKLAKVGSEYADRFMHNYNKIDDNDTFRGLNKETGQWEEITGADVKNRIDDQMRKEITPGAVEAIFESDSSGRKAMKIFKPGSEFMDHLAKVNPKAYEKAVAKYNYYQEVGRPGAPVRQEDAESTLPASESTINEFMEDTATAIDSGAKAVEGRPADEEKNQPATPSWASEKAARDEAIDEHRRKTEDADIGRPEDLDEQIDRERRKRAA